MQPYEDSRSAPTPKLKVVPPSQLKPIEEPSLPPPPPIKPKALNNDSNGKKHHHMLIMVGTIVVAVVGISFISWSHKISRASSIEPNPEEFQAISLSPNHILKSLGNIEVKTGEEIAVTDDPQYDEKLRKIAQEISNTLESEKLAQQGLQFAIRQAEEAKASRQTAITRLDQSLKNVERGTSVIINEQDVVAKQAERDGAIADLSKKEQHRATNVQAAINAGAASASEEKVMALDTNIQQLKDKINVLNAQISQAQLKSNLERDRVGDNSQEEYSRLTEKDTAVDSANQRVNQAQQEIFKINSQLQGLKREEQILKQEKDQQTTYKAEFTGVADLTEARKYVGKKLNKLIEIVVYNPQNMLGKMLASDAEYNEIKNYQNDSILNKNPLKITFTLENGKEIKGTVQPVSLQSEGKPDVNPPDKRLHEVWIAFDDPQEFKKGMTGNATIMMREERIYNIVGREVSNIMPFLRPIFYHLSGGQ
jgi:hypothetical protein